MKHLAMPGTSGWPTGFVWNSAPLFVKTYYVSKGFEAVTASCPVPVVIAGGEKVPELEALAMAHRALQEGAAGVDMGRNIFQAEAPSAMVQAVRAVVHEGETPERALDLYRSLQDLGVKEDQAVEEKAGKN
jgi:3-hydroxy-5-phosphonooxypentane-2,4-dione thiolase